MDTQTNAAPRKKPTAGELRKRMQRLVKQGVKTSQIATVLGVSYNGAHGFLTGRVEPSEVRLPDYHKRLTSWCKQIAQC